MRIEEIFVLNPPIKDFCKKKNTIYIDKSAHHNILFWWNSLTTHNSVLKIAPCNLKGYSSFLGEIGLFYHSLKVKQLGFTVF